MLKRKVFRGIIADKLRHLEFGWLARRAWAMVSMKSEKYLHTGKAPAPLMAVLMVTENCNLRCPMCGLPERFRCNPNNADTAAWKRAIDDLHELGAAGVGFTGGEATTRKDIFELIAHARKLGFPVTLNSNALLLSDDKLDALAKSDPTNINISIDSGRDDINDQLRGGKDVLKRTLERIKALVEKRKTSGARYTVTVVTVLSDANIGDLEILFQKASSAGADRIGFMPLHDIAPGKCCISTFQSDTTRLAATLRDLSARYNLPLENSDAYLDAFHSFMSHQTLLPVPCNAGYTTIVLGPDLKIYRCWPYYEKQQVFREWDQKTAHLKDLWNDAEFRRERQLALKCKECVWNCHAEISYLVRM